MSGMGAKLSKLAASILGRRSGAKDAPDAGGVGSQGGTATNAPAASPDAAAGTVDLSAVVWLDRDVLAWPVNVDLGPVTISGGGRVTLPYSVEQAKAAGWQIIDGLWGNPWVLVPWTDGKTYAATWEFLKTGQTVKNMKGKSWAEHINHGPLNRWEPKSGETYGWMVSALARRPKCAERPSRSNVRWAVWP